MHGNCAGHDQHLCFHYIDGTIPLLPSCPMALLHTAKEIRCVFDDYSGEAIAILISTHNIGFMKK